ncbi:MAG: response regulator transcription factor [Polyangiaceae bacterium]
MVQILLVDDHPLFHEGLASAFARLAPDLSIVSADSAEAGLTVLRDSSHIELALIDLILPTLDGLAALALYAAEFPHIPRLLISGKDDAAIIAKARDAGASGFLRKSLPLDQLLAALRAVLDGGAYFDLRTPVPPALVGREGADSGRDPSGDLTLRQLEVLKLLGSGRSNKEISSELAIADRTVRAHLTELFRTLGVSSRTQAVLAAQRLGLLGVP